MSYCAVCGQGQIPLPGRAGVVACVLMHGIGKAEARQSERLVIELDAQPVVVEIVHPGSGHRRRYRRTLQEWQIEIAARQNECLKRYEGGESLSQIGASLSISRERVSQLCKRAAMRKRLTEPTAETWQEIRERVVTARLR